MPRRRWAGSLLLALLPTALTLLPAATPPSFAALPSTPADTATPRTAGPTDTALVPLPALSTTTTQVASGPRRPTALAAPDDGTGRLFI
ncbi:hypothetical protein GCM10010271_31810 [Streptomyces kurssanovii]|nr:hypothetical protein GCM10010271_31810 [Streptomyces kurssanovii]